MTKLKHKALTVSQELSAAGLIPDVLPDDFRSAYSVNATFGCNNFDSGAKVPPGEMDHPHPVYKLIEARHGSYYTFILVDPDSSPMQGSRSEVQLLHLVTNVSGQQPDSRNGNELVPYKISRQDQGHIHGTHRYLLIALEQPQEGQQQLHIAPPKYRTQFSVLNFIHMNKVKPVGATLLHVSWDDYRPSKSNSTNAQAREQDSLAYAESMVRKSKLLNELVLEGSVHFKVPVTLTINEEIVNAGDEVPAQVMDLAPVVQFHPGLEEVRKANALYTVICADADFPSIHQPTDRSMLLMLATNIPGTSGDSRIGDPVVPYVSPLRLAGSTGIHRYFVLLLEQHGGALEEGAIDPPENRRAFSFHDFLKTHTSLEAVNATFFLGRRKG